MNVVIAHAAPMMKNMSRVIMLPKGWSEEYLHTGEEPEPQFPVFIKDQQGRVRYLFRSNGDTVERIAVPRYSVRSCIVYQEGEMVYEFYVLDGCERIHTADSYASAQHWLKITYPHYTDPYAYWE